MRDVPGARKQRHATWALQLSAFPTCMRKILTSTVAEALLAVPIVILNDHRISEKVTKFIKSFKRTVYVQACRIEWGTPFARFTPHSVK